MIEWIISATILMSVLLSSQLIIKHSICKGKQILSGFKIFTRQITGQQTVNNRICEKSITSTNRGFKIDKQKFIFNVEKIND